VEQRNYEDFFLRIRKDSAGYVAIPTSRDEVGPGPGAPFVNPFQESDLDELRTFRGSSVRDLDSPKKTAQSRPPELGQRLFETVFAGKIRRFWERSLDQAHLHKHGLRLRLILESPELWDWPWEYLREPNEDFLILSRGVSIVRCPEVHRVVPALPIKQPLRVVVVIAQPRGSAELDSEREWQALKNALASLEKSGRVKLDRVDAATRPALRKALAQPVHVLHFIGHGGFDSDRDEAYLQFETREGEPDPVTGIDLARVLRRQSPPALVVLNACEGGRAVKADPFAGVAQALVREGMSAVVAMQFRVSDESALAFSKALYEALAAGEMIDHALFEARNALASEGSLDWGNPVLYLRGIKDIFPPPPGSGLKNRRLVAVAGALLLVALSGGAYFLAPFMGPSPYPPGSVKGCPPIEDLGIVFKRINRGTFIMGGHGEGPDAKPHRVTITRSFCMSEKEITRQQWLDVMHEAPSKYKKWSAQPVESVSWNRVQDFLRELQPRDLKARFRLPTEAQWEYAARAKTETRYSFGNDPAELPKYGNCAKSDDHFDTPAPVGTFAPNNLGLFDMQGNVSEWVEDWYALYEAVAQIDPTGPERSTEKVRRGGSFSIIAKSCTVAKRNKMSPDKGKDDVGFRIIRDVEP